jgi:hypothetical protein
MVSPNDVEGRREELSGPIASKKIGQATKLIRAKAIHVWASAKRSSSCAARSK